MAMTKGGRPLAIQTQATQRILNAAQDLAQTRGFHGFSYADVAQELQVTKASLHYHFPAKADLGHALIARHHVLFGKALQSIDRQTHKAGKKLRRYVGLHDSVVRNNQLSLSGMLAAECATLPGAGGTAAIFRRERVMARGRARRRAAHRRTSVSRIR